MGISLRTLADLVTRLLPGAEGAGRVTAIELIAEGDWAAVARCTLGDGSTVIAKVQAGSARIAHAEREALILLGRAGADMVPAVIAAGRSVVVLEDLGRSRTLRELLLAPPSPAAPEALTTTVRRLGELHVVGRALVGAFRGRGEKRALRTASDAEDFLNMLPRWQRYLEDFGGGEPDGLGGAWTAVAARLASPGPWQTLTHGDLTPRNVVLARRGPVLLDFERAGVRHALYDTALLHIGTPMPPALRERVLAGYREAVADVVPEAADPEAFAREQAWLVAHRGLLTVAMLLPQCLQGDLALTGGWSARAVLLDALAVVAEQCGSDPKAEVLAAAASALREGLVARWPEVVSPLPVYPALVA